MVAKTVKKNDATSVKAAGKKKQAKSAKGAVDPKNQEASQRKPGGPGKKGFDN